MIAERSADTGDVVVLADLVAGDSDGIAQLPPFDSLEHPVAVNLLLTGASLPSVFESLAFALFFSLPIAVGIAAVLPWSAYDRPPTATGRSQTDPQRPSPAPS